MPTDWKNKLYFGDNLHVLRNHVADEAVDLIYLDPPFNSNATYNVLFQERSGERSAAQIMAFEDTWEWGEEAQKAFDEMVMRGSGRLPGLMQALSAFLGPSNMLAYLVMMGERLVELHRVLKPTGSIYLHCDPTASHYLKLVMDAVWGPERFCNEITWKRSHAHNDGKQGARHFGRVTDTILFYNKGNQSTWNPQFLPYDEKYLDRDYRRVDPDGRRYRIGDLSGPGGAAKGSPSYEFLGVTRYWRYSQDKMEALFKQGRIVQTRPGAVPQYKRYLDEMPGVPLQNLWADLPGLNNRSKEVLGYPTQKPEALLERIIAASSNEGDVVLDPFCGCGTATAAAERLHRRWIGIDITYLAIDLIKRRLQKAYGGDLAPYEVLGVPVDLAGAHALANTADGRYQFESWALGLVDAHPAHDRKKGADSGIDGCIYFRDDPSGPLRKILVQVKSGHVTRNQIGDLIGVMHREKAELAAFVTLEESTKPMRDEALQAGYYVPNVGVNYQVPRVQIITIADLLTGKRIDYPRWAAAATFKVAPHKSKQLATQNEMAL